MRTSALLVVAAVACGPTGLTIEVVVGADVSNVELYVGKTCYDECPPIVTAPDLLAKPLSDTYLTFDGDATAETPKDGLVGFRIETDSDVTIGVILLVAHTTDDGIKTAVFYNTELDAGETTRWVVRDLVITQPLVDARAPTDTRRIKMWGLPTPHCVLLERWTGDRPDAYRDLIVPKTDTDCDNLPMECAPWTYLAEYAPPTIERADCLVLEDKFITAPVCVMAGPDCSEVGQSGSQCSPLPDDYCTPKDLCGCLKPVTETCLDGKLMASIIQGVPMPHLSCHFALDTSGNPCSGSAVVADAGIYFPATTTVKCTAIRFADMNPPFGPFVTQAMTKEGTAKVTLENFTESCKVDLRFEGTATTHIELGLVELELDNGRHLVLPARAEMVRGDCIQDSRCDFIPIRSAEETLPLCITAPKPVTCFPTSTCTTGGAECGGHCCPYGETCNANGVCGCNGGTTCMNGDTCQSRLGTPDGCGEICCGGTNTCPL